MAPPTVIVFGPTGAVGSAAARTAEANDSKVILAMRNTDKAIPGLADAAEVPKGNFEKIYADLTKPDTVHDAVNKSGAKHAFIYLAHGSSDHMKATIEALKSGGIEFVVFLSSFTVRGNPREIEPIDVIPYVHARVEISLEEVFGADKFVAVRPGAFAGNMLQYKAELKTGQVKAYKPEATVDCIVQEDIGRVCGTVLARGAQDGQMKIYLYGPELISQRNCIRTMAKAIGEDPNIESSNEEEAYKKMDEQGIPPPIASYMMRRMGRNDTGPDQVFGYPISDEGRANVQKYSGQKATTFAEWVEQNKSLLV